MTSCAPSAFLAPCLWLAVALLGGAPGPVGAQGDGSSGSPETPFVGEERVTALDLLVGPEPEGLRRFTGNPRLPKDFRVDDLRIEHGGREHRSVVAEPVVEGRPQAAEPWTLAVFVDGANSRTAQLRWALGLLAERAEDWVRLGQLEVVVAMPDVRVALPATRDLQVVRSGLSKLALEVEGNDALADLRYAVRGAALESGAALEKGEGVFDAASALALEQARVLRHQDELLVYLTERWVTAGPRRCLVWVTGGFDLDPERFYGAALGSADGGPSTGGLSDWPGLGSPGLVSETEDFVRTLAAHGWITAPMVAPPPDPLRGKARGARVGKLRFLGPAATYEEDRRPERAEAYLELAAAHRGGGRFEEAADAYDRAYYYFWGDPRTKDRQAVALAGLGAMLEKLGEEAAARRALEMAAELDPSALPELTLPPTGRLHDPLEALRWTAAATSGHLVRSHSGLGELVDDLELRLRVTYQVAGEPTGELEPVSVRWQQRGEEASEPVRAVQWSRLGAPARLDRALARVALERPESELGAGVAFGGREVLEIEPLSLDGAELKVTLDMGWPVAGPRPRGLRLTLASSAPTRMDPEGVKGAGPPEVASRLWPIVGGPIVGGPSLEEPVPFDLRGAAVAVIWRDLDSGLWGGIRHPTGLP